MASRVLPAVRVGKVGNSRVPFWYQRPPPPLEHVSSSLLPLQVRSSSDLAEKSSSLSNSSSSTTKPQQNRVHHSVLGDIAFRPQVATHVWCKVELASPLRLRYMKLACAALQV
eukprot:4160942-Amphidinium_carterae.2